MNILTKLFNTRKHPPDSLKSRAIIFVDYEHWYYSYQKLYGLKPDPISWLKKLEELYILEDIMVFADFGHKGIKEEIQKLRNITNTIIETQQTFKGYKKDMTDFIMLDYIYQTSALRPEIGTYILFTGDGHFQSVTKYLTQRLGKNVIIYGVANAFSNQLKAVATASFQLPQESEKLKAYYGMIVSNLAYVSDHNTIIPTFKGTVSAVARKNEVPEDAVQAALQEMMDKGLIYQREHRVDFNRKVKIIAANWEALAKAGLWSFES